MQVMERFNRMLEVLERTLPADGLAELQRVLVETRGIPYRRIATLVFRPSEDLGQLAGDHLRRIGSSGDDGNLALRFALRQLAPPTDSGPWEADWASFLQSNFGNTNGAQSISEYQSDPIFAFRIMGDTDSVAQNLQVRATMKDKGEAGDCEMLIFCLGTSVIEAQYDDDASFQPTAVSVQEVV